MPDADLAFKFFRKSIGNCSCYNILAPICINKNCPCYNNEQQADQHPFNYFLEGLQKQGFKL